MKLTIFLIVFMWDEPYHSSLYEPHQNLTEQPFISCCTRIWEGYDQPFFHFCLNKQGLNLIKKRTSWQEAVKGFEGFVFFKSVEEDIIWIGKSDKLSFNTLI